MSWHLTKFPPTSQPCRAPWGKDTRTIFLPLIQRCDWHIAINLLVPCRDCFSFSPSGKWVLQRLAWGHCCCQHLLWQGHCDGWGNMCLKQSCENVLEMERSIRMGPVDFIASLGGLFGLCLGFSIISFMEIIYWVFSGLCRAIFSKHYWNEKHFLSFIWKRKMVLNKESPLHNKSWNPEIFSHMSPPSSIIFARCLLWSIVTFWSDITVGTLSMNTKYTFLLLWSRFESK